MPTGPHSSSSSSPEGALLDYGLKDSTKDIDVICRSEALLDQGVFEQEGFNLGVGDDEV